MAAPENKRARLGRHRLDENVQLPAADQAIVVGGVFTQAEVEMAGLVGFDDLAGRVPHFGFHAAPAHCAKHGAILAHQQFGAFVARDGAVDLYDGRYGALLAEAAKTHDLIVDIHSIRLYIERRAFLPLYCAGQLSRLPVGAVKCAFQF